MRKANFARKGVLVGACPQFPETETVDLCKQIADSVRKEKDDDPGKDWPLPVRMLAMHEQEGSRHKSREDALLLVLHEHMASDDLPVCADRARVVLRACAQSTLPPVWFRVLSGSTSPEWNRALWGVIARLGVAAWDPEFVVHELGMGTSLPMLRLCLDEALLCLHSSAPEFARSRAWCAAASRVLAGSLAEAEYLSTRSDLDEEDQQILLDACKAIELARRWGVS